jgi:predicted dehydrogenase
MLNIGIVGCGYWGPNLIRNFSTFSNCNMRMLCDVDAGRLAHMKTVYPHVETTAKFEEVIKNDDIDAVAIATPVRFHFDMAKASLLAGKHTFVEKPLARTTQECEELISLAQKQNLTLMVGHTFIYSSSVRKIKEIVDHGDLGEIQYISSRRLNLGLFQKDINVAWDLAPHDLTIIFYVMGKTPIGVNCQGKAHITDEIEDVTNMTLTFANGAIALIQSSWLDPNKIRQMTFVGKRRMLVYDDTEPLEKIKIYDKRVETPPHYDTFAEFHYAYHYGDMYCPYVKQGEPLKIECQHFLDCIKFGTEPISSGMDGLNVVKVLEAASKSLKNGGSMVLIDKPLLHLQSTSTANPIH